MTVISSESASLATFLTLGADFDELYIFGDSLSDPGNLFDLSGGTVPATPYFQGRFSNGPVWTEYLAEDLNLSPVGIAEVQANPLAAAEGINFALAGANSDDSNSNNSNSLNPAGAPPLPGLTAQIDGYQTFVDAIGPSARDNPLHVLWVGANDYLGGGQTNPQVTLANIEEALQDLYDGGARNFLVPNLPNLGDTPVGQSQAPELLNTLTAAHNQGLEAMLEQFEQDNPDAGVILFDVNAVFVEVQQSPSDFGFTTTGGCFTLADLLGGSLEPDAVQTCGQTSLFWDDLHPTTQAHDILADEAFTLINESLMLPGIPPVIPPIAGPTVTGTAGNDQLPVNGGRVLGLAGDDQIFNNAGASELLGGSGNDGLFGSSDRDWLDGGSGNDKLYGNGGDNIFLGGAGNDEIYGGEGAEIALAGDGDDLIYGNGGRDVLVGDAGNDKIWAAEGDDVLVGGAGDDMLYGGGGHDLFVYGLGDGGDVIEDFRAGEDSIGLIQGELTFADVNLKQDGHHTVLGVASTGETLAVLKFTQASALDESSFTLVSSISTPEQAVAVL